MKRYDANTAHQIIAEALVPDIADARSQRLHGHRTALKSALNNFTQSDFACQLLSMPIHKQRAANADLQVEEVPSKFEMPTEAAGVPAKKQERSAVMIAKKEQQPQ